MQLDNMYNVAGRLWLANDTNEKDMKIRMAVMTRDLNDTESFAGREF